MEMLDQLYTLEDLEKLSDEFELDEGRLVEMTRPSPEHGAVCAAIGAALWAHCRKTGEAVVCSNDSGCILARNPDTLRGPDVAVFLRPRWERCKSRQWFEGAPDLAVEVMSPSQPFAELQRKVSQYLAAGAALVWMVDPVRRKVVTYQPDGLVQIVTLGEVLAGAPVLPDFRLPVSDLFLD